jgi:hypothetical protein
MFLFSLAATHAFVIVFSVVRSSLKTHSITFSVGKMNNGFQVILIVIYPYICNILNSLFRDQYIFSTGELPPLFKSYLSLLGKMLTAFLISYSLTLVAEALWKEEGPVMLPLKNTELFLARRLMWY